MQVEENGGVVMGAEGRDGGTMACLALGLEGREISFVILEGSWGYDRLAGGER